MPDVSLFEDASVGFRLKQIQYCYWLSTSMAQRAIAPPEASIQILQAEYQRLKGAIKQQLRRGN
jgi:hypothetical protein